MVAFYKEERVVSENEAQEFQRSVQGQGDVKRYGGGVETVNEIAQKLEVVRRR